MKGSQREVWRAITEEVSTLCSFCKYAKWFGSCDSAGVECKHPLEDSFGYPYDEHGLEPGSDCWAFRPKFELSIAADVCGIWLQGLAVNWSTVPLKGAA
ncbi:hypothetical protein LCGC14_2489010 [marine sediment metagenome]|uniref:Uncharacterized protein n=1 Tax=marine sediment metagenome TaxID=412755 RepID=A0A0F9B5E1_9ZZZZ